MPTRPPVGAGPWPIRCSYAELKPAAWFLAHPLNFRPSTSQLDEYLAGSLDELGWIKPVIVNQRTDPAWGTDQHVETVIDGHKRVRKALQHGDETPVPLDWVDLPPHLEPTALLILDEMVSYGPKDQAQLALLLEDAKPADAALQKMLSRIVEKEKGVVEGMSRLRGSQNLISKPAQTEVLCPHCGMTFISIG